MTTIKAHGSLNCLIVIRLGWLASARFLCWTAWRCICNCKTAHFCRICWIIQNFFVPLQLECCCAAVQPFLLLLHTCIRSTLNGKRSDALLSCALESGKFKISKQDGVRRFTYIRGLVVSWSFCKVFQNRSVEIVGYTGPRFVFILDSMAQVYRYISIGLCHLWRPHYPAALSMTWAVYKLQ